MEELSCLLFAKMVPLLMMILPHTLMTGVFQNEMKSFIIKKYLFGLWVQAANQAIWINCGITVPKNPCIICTDGTTAAAGDHAVS